MTHNVTPAVQRALDLAAQLSHPLEVQCHHVLSALLAEDEGRPAALLLQQGVGIEDARNALQSAVAGPNVTLVLQAARTLAREVAGEPTVATEHLFLAILQEDEGVRRLLAERG